MDIDEAVNCTVRIGSGHHGQYGEQHDVRKTVKLAFRASRVFDLGKQGEKRGQRRHGNLGASESGCPPKSQRFQSAGILPPMAQYQSPKLGFGQISERAHEARGMRNIGSFSTIS